jgi:cytidine deaminase
MTRARDVDMARLVEAARTARARAHAPYSNYKVGAALLTRRGGMYAGCNVENATFGATLCAERSAVAAMVAGGDRDPVACVVVTGGPRPGSPCGICRQVLAEFARDMPIVLVAEDEAGRVTARSTQSLAALLPLAFRLRPLRGSPPAPVEPRSSRKARA